VANQDFGQRSAFDVVAEREVNTMTRINCLLAVLVFSCLGCGALLADGAGGAGKCKVTYFTDATNPLTKKGEWLAVGNGTYRMLATCSANEVAISGGYNAPG
jgi:hypothetical protein